MFPSRITIPRQVQVNLSTKLQYQIKQLPFKWDQLRSHKSIMQHYTVVRKKFTAEYFPVKIIHDKIFSSFRVAMKNVDNNFLKVKFYNFAHTILNILQHWLRLVMPLAKIMHPLSHVFIAFCTKSEKASLNYQHTRYKLLRC